MDTIIEIEIEIELSYLVTFKFRNYEKIILSGSFGCHQYVR